MNTSAGGFSARFFFHDPQNDAVKKKQKALYLDATPLI
jgi:hypothetical protein